MSFEHISDEMNRQIPEVGVVGETRMLAYRILTVCNVELDLDSITITEQLVRDHVHEHTNYGDVLWLEDEDFDFFDPLGDEDYTNEEWHDLLTADKKSQAYHRYWHIKIYGEDIFI